VFFFYDEANNENKKSVSNENLVPELRKEQGIRNLTDMSEVSVFLLESPPESLGLN